MEKKRKIISIDIELEDFEPIHMKMDEARELYEQLHDLFGEAEVQHHYYPWYQQPYYRSITTCGGTLDAITSTTTTARVLSTNTGMQVSYNIAA